jgi:hypothetical protein
VLQAKNFRGHILEEAMEVTKKIDGQKRCTKNLLNILAVFIEI